MKRAGRFLGRAALVIVAVAATLWAALTLHFAPLVAPPWGDGLAALLLLTTVLAFLRLRLIQAGLVSLLAPAVVLVAFLQLRPINDRPWETEYAVLASFRRDGDVVHVSNIRNFKWTSATTAIPGYHDATFNLSDVQSVDLVMSYWAGDAIAHVFVSFGLADGRHLAISAETRRAVGQDYSTLGGFFRNYELIYVVADESDLIGVRTNMRGERVYLYRLHVAPHIPRQLLLSYLQKIDALAHVPEFYNTVDDNCTSNVISRIETTAGSDGRPPYSWKLLLSGYTDSYAYDLGRLDRNLPFPELKRRSLIAPQPVESAGEDFSLLIRENLP
ncbi:MAG: DUF4105 domain-containing protein [Proteobacteria bacterium]|nr:DUF4105 domain-containing protein [Pseudomonadota bacterium]